ncbi:40S ribosomal protein S10 [Butyriboletus roseoflavus]|nr:40S ribosomal protein S10 [Butyriboletus roseoflavus]
MLISKQNKRLIYENLFKGSANLIVVLPYTAHVYRHLHDVYTNVDIEGVLVAKKDYNAPKHEELEVPNLEVIKAMQSLTSKGLVKTQFSWQWYYYVLTPEGVEYLREWLHLPNEIVPATHKRAARPPRPATVRPGESAAPRPPRGDQEGYRRKEGGTPGDFKASFAGVGRGGPWE